MRSRPLVQIDSVMNSTVHPKKLDYTLNIQGFPFGDGHPARNETAQVIQGFRQTAEFPKDAFIDGEVESVLITNFLKYPVNPSVVTSFTQPLHASLGRFSPDLLRSSFWQWRRARVLENFIPLPDDLRRAAIRGFAIARALGLVTNLPRGGNQISTEAGVLSFPQNFLTETDHDNVLPCLLEAMILAFAEGPTRGKAAFEAYGALISYGGGGAGFQIEGAVARILKTGDYGQIKILDQEMADVLGTTPVERVSQVNAHLDRRIKFFDELDATRLDPQSWRNMVGSVVPVSTLSRELLPDLRRGYVMVRQAVQAFGENLPSSVAGRIEKS